MGLSKFPAREEAWVLISQTLARPLMTNMDMEKVIGPENALFILQKLEAAGFRVERSHFENLGRVPPPETTSTVK